MGTALAEGQITLTVNGVERNAPVGTTLADLLTTLQLDARMIVVEHNRTIVHDRECFAARELVDGDVLELVHFVGGG